MKPNMTALKKWYATLLFLALPAFLFAFDSSKAHLSFEPFFSYQYGKIGEYLYARDDSASDFERISYLEWEEKPVWLYGLQMNASYKHLYVGAAVTTALPASCGKMYDSDWMDRNNLGLKTNFSESDNSLHSHIDVNGTLGFIIFPEKTFRIMPFAGVGFYNTVFKANGAECWYGDTQTTNLSSDVSWNDASAKHFYVSDSETVIEYNLHSLYTLLGCQFMLVPTERLAFDFSLSVAPYSYIVAIDNHILRSIKFKDEIDSYFRIFKGRISAYYTFNDILAAGLSVGGVYSIMNLGYSYITTNNKSYAWIVNEKGGTDIKAFNVTASLKINVF